MGEIAVGLTGLVIVDVAISIVFLVLLVSIAATALVEALSSFLQWRGAALAQGMRHLLGKGFGDFCQQPLIDSLKTDGGIAHLLLSGPLSILRWLGGLIGLNVDTTDWGRRRPSYVDPDLFAKEMLSWFDVRHLSPKEILDELRAIAEGTRKPPTKEITAAIAALPSHAALEAKLAPPVGTTEGSLQKWWRERKLRLAKKARDAAEKRLKAAETDLEEAKVEIAKKLVRVLNDGMEKIDEVEAAVGKWFDRSMDRVGGWFKRRTRTTLFFVGFLFAATLNIDMLAYGKKLIEDDALRTSQVNAAVEAVTDRSLEEFRKELDLAAPEETDTPDDASETAAQTPEAALEALREEMTVKLEEFERTSAAARAAVAGTGAVLGWRNIQTGEPIDTFGAWWHYVTGDRDRFVSQILPAFFSWLIMGFAVTLGAQFWFDLLKTFVSLRSAGKPAQRADGGGTN
ncbi:MAG: hypothetical protein AAFN17_06235 [Pseudomonadota bacterium]